MAKHTGKMNYLLKEVPEECTPRESVAISDEDSKMPSVDSKAVAMFLQGGDITLDKKSSDEDSDANWEPDSSPPVSKRQRQVEQQDSTSSGEEALSPHPSRGSASRRPRGRGRGRGRGQGRGKGKGRGRWRGSRSRSQTRLSTSTSGERWNDADNLDITPPQPTFKPTRLPGPQLELSTPYTALQLFQLFFTNSVLKTIIQNTNDFGSRHHSTSSDPWIDLTLEDMFAFMSLVVFMGVVECPTFTDYWRGGNLYSLQFPRGVMTSKKFERICKSLHLSSSVKDVANRRRRRGTAAFDHLCKIKPLYEEMREACKKNYHPYQDIAIDERTVSPSARIELKQYVKDKPVCRGYKLFILVDSKSGYTWDFFVHKGNVQGNSGKGLSYESVMELMDTQRLGIGYKLFVDSFFTSPTLFRDLLQKRIWACGTIYRNRIEYPKTNDNSLDSKSPCGSIRWIRRDSVLFVHWRNQRDVFMCSTLHTAHAEDIVRRRVQGADGHSVVKDIPVPPAVKDYSRCTSRVDLTDSPDRYYTILQKTRKWYKWFFYHFLDIAIMNAFLLHKEIGKIQGGLPKTQKVFRETLAQELAEAGSPARHEPTPPAAPHHRPVHISGHSTTGRLKCRHCHMKTPVKCSSCDVPLCLIPGRDCYNNWHVPKNL